VVDVSGYLASKGLPIKRADAHNIHTACVFCSEDPGARGRLYINVDPDADIAGLFFCHRCQEKGSLASLKRYFGDQVHDDDLDHQTRLEIFNEAAAFYQSALRHFGEVVEYLTGPQRGLTTETIDALGGMVTIPYEVAGNCVAIRGRTWPMTPADFAQWAGAEYTPPANKYKTCGGSSSRLYNTDACWDSDEIVVTEGELDAIMLEQHGFRAVAAPGASAWQESWDDYLVNIKRVWLLYDRDAAGEKAATRLVERLGSKIRRILLSEEGTKCDPTEWFARDGHTAAEFEELLAVGRKGALLVSVREAASEFATIQSQPGLKFGWELFDIMLDPGLQPGQLMIVLAKTGSGKTIFALNLMHRVVGPRQADPPLLRPRRRRGRRRSLLGAQHHARRPQPRQRLRATPGPRRLRLPDGSPPRPALHRLPGLLGPIVPR
jgi:5S rRNA maturation endonuclease (ribonuclease M5)